MTLEQLTGPEVYDGPIDEDIEPITYEANGWISVRLRPTSDMVEKLNIEELDVNITGIIGRVNYTTEVEAWNEDMANDMLWGELKSHAGEIREKLDEADIDGSVQMHSDETWIEVVDSSR